MDGSGRTTTALSAFPEESTKIGPVASLYPEAWISFPVESTVGIPEARLAFLIGFCFAREAGTGFANRNGRARHGGARRIRDSAFQNGSSRFGLRKSNLNGAQQQ